MSDHLSPEILAALVDAELAGDALALASQHLAGCSICTSRALNESLLQRATARAGQRYSLPESFEARVRQSIAAQQNQSATASIQHMAPSRPRFSPLAWAASLAAVLLVTASGFVAHNLTVRDAHTSALVAETALITEATDEHIAAMAAAAPQVISTDRHTVKPWFQGKLPFSFNLPAALPPDITLDGANLAQLEGAPAAQLIFSIGKHHASVFLRQRAAQSLTDYSIHYTAERNGFHIDGFRTAELDGLAVSDADPARLHALAIAVQQAQAGP